MSEAKIDRGVPIPPRMASIPWNDMKVGDSVLFERSRQPSVASYASTYKKRTGKGFTIKTVSSTECRLWRIK